MVMMFMVLLMKELREPSGEGFETHKFHDFTCFLCGAMDLIQLYYYIPRG